MSKRDVASSPAKSERMVRDSSGKKVPARRLSQDSGIVAGRLFNGAVSINNIELSHGLGILVWDQRNPLISLLGCLIRTKLANEYDSCNVFNCLLPPF